MSTHQPPLPLGNLLPLALAGVRQQHAFCLQAASALEAADLHVLAHTFRFTARQEAEHAAILGAMPEDAPPAALSGSPEALLQAAIAREEASCALLQEAARRAQDAARPRLALTLQRIAETEAAHARRFRRCLARLQDQSLLHSHCSVSWFCLGCGGIHHGCDAPEACESCGRSRGHFIRSDHSPFACG
ncbi:MAG: rubrerythrin family protein [Clostridia bacterium]|nr:rubrerythrin family protein [Clostridia bacterium]